MNRKTTKISDIFGILYVKVVGLRGIILVAIFAITQLLGSSSHPALAATSSTLNFQGRLYTSSGSVVPDGYYNIQFKLYDGGTDGGPGGTGEANAGTNLWTESYYDSNGVSPGNDNRLRVVNGYFSANLGSQTAFPSINWDQELWLTMNVGGPTQTASPTYDGEMLQTGSKRTKLTGVPYAFRAGAITDGSGNAYTGDDLIHNSTSPQTANINIQSAASGSITALLQGAASQSVNILEARNSGGTPLLELSPDGNLTVRRQTAFSTAISLYSPGDTNARLALYNSGGIEIGSGSAARDVGINRTAAGTLTIYSPSNAAAATLRVLGSTVQSSTDLFQIQTSTPTTVFSVGATGSVLSKNSSDSTSAFQIQNASGVDDIFTVDTSNRQVVINESGTTATTGLTIHTASGSDALSIVPGTGLAGESAYIDFNSGRATVGYNGTTGDAVLIGESGKGLRLVVDGTVDALDISSTGQALFKNGTDSTTAFQIQDTTGTSNLFVADTDNLRIGIGAAPANSLLTIGANTTNAAGGITFGTDTSLYRAGSGSLKTDGEFVAGEYISAFDGAFGQTFIGDWNGSQTVDGAIVFGQSQDTNLYRSAADTLETDDSLIVNGTLVADTNFFSPSASGISVSSNSPQWLELDRRFMGTGNLGAPDRLEIEVTGGDYWGDGTTVYYIDFRNGLVVKATEYNGGADTGFYSLKIYGEDAVASNATNKYRIGLAVGNGSNFYSINVKARELADGQWIDIVSGTEPSTGYTDETPSIIYGDFAAGAGLFQTTSATALQIQKADATNVLTADSSNNRILIGASAANVTGEAVTVRTATSTWGVVHTDGTRTVGTYIDASGAWFGTKSSTVLKFFTGDQSESFTLGTNGSATFENNTNSATAFVIQDSANAALFTADTAARSASGGNLIKIGNSTGTDTNTTILQLDAATAAPTTNLSALNGGLFYNSNTHRINIIENGVVKVLCNQTDASCGGNSTTLQQSYDADADGSDTIIQLSSSDDGIVIRNPSSSGSDSTYNLVLDQLSTGAKGGLSIQSAGTGNLLLITDTTATARDVLTVADKGWTTFRNQTDGTSAFQVQNAAGTSILNVDSTNKRLTVGSQGTATGQLYVAGAVPSSSYASVGTGGGLSTDPESIAIKGNYAYVASYGESDLDVVDISNPASPVVISSTDFSSAGTNPEHIAVAGKYAYMAMSSSDVLAVVDISNPYAPTLVDTIGTGDYPTFVAISGNYAYVLNDFTGDTITVVDISDPTNVSLVSTFTDVRNPRKAYIEGKYMYVADLDTVSGHAELNIVDISNPANLVSVDTEAVGTGTTSLAIAKSGKYVYLSEDVTSIYVLDVSNPSSIVELTSIFSDADIEDMVVQGRYLYGVSNQGATSKLYTYDISSPASPSIVGSVTVGNDPWHLAISGRYAYIPIFTNDSLQVYDLGGAYIQQLETGGIQATTINVQDITINNNTTIGGSLTVAGPAQFQRGISVIGTSTFAGDLVASAAPTSSGTTQTQTMVDGTSINVGTNIGAKIGGDGLLVIVSQDLTNNKLRITHCNNASCTSSSSASYDSVKNVASNDWRTVIAIGQDGYPVIAYSNSSTHLAVMKCSSYDCSSNSVTDLFSSDSASIGQTLSIAIGQDGYPVISQHSTTTGFVRVVDCGNASCSSGNTFNDIETVAGGYDTSIAIASDGKPIVAWYKASATNALYVTKCGNVSCSSGNTTTSLESGTGIGQQPSIIIAADGYPAVTYLSNTVLKFIKCTNASCSSFNSPVTLDASTVTGGYSSLALGLDNNPIVSYKNDTSDDLYVVKCNTPTCSSIGTKTNLHSHGSNNLGQYTAIVVPSDGLPLVLDQDVTNTDVYVTKCAVVDCSSTTGGSISGGVNIGSSTKYFNNVYAINYFGHNYSVSSYDVAEEYEVEDQTLKSAEIVALNPVTGKLRRASSGDRSNLLGIISTKPGLALRDYEADRTDTRLVALVGRVPLKVKGPIVAGDPITISETDGVGEKATTAGMIVGRALETTASDATIEVFVQTQYFVPQYEQGGINFCQFQNVSITGEARIATLVVSGDATFNGRLIVAGHFVTAGDAPDVSVAEEVVLGANTEEPEVTIAGNDTSGTITVDTTGLTDDIQEGDLVDVTFSEAYAKVPKVFIQPANDSASDIRIYRDVTTDKFVVKLKGSLAPGKKYRFDYFVVE